MGIGKLSQLPRDVLFPLPNSQKRDRIFPIWGIGIMDEQDWLECQDPRRMYTWLTRGFDGCIGLKDSEQTRNKRLLTDSESKFIVDACSKICNCSTFPLNYNLLDWINSTMDAWGSCSLNKCVIAEIMKHTIGNPFNPYEIKQNLPFNVIVLTKSLLNGEDCAFALTDALLECGEPDLAEHFTICKTLHPKTPSYYEGCWAINLILNNP